MLIFAKLEFADLYQASYVSKGFRVWADAAIKSFYVIQHGGGTYLNYTLIIRELNRPFKGVKMRDQGNIDNLAFRGLPHVSCIRSILEPRFGHCVGYDRCQKVCLVTRKVSVHILRDPQKSTALPYILDFDIHNSAWIHVIRGLAELKRFDLLGQMAFQKSTSSVFTN